MNDDQRKPRTVKAPVQFEGLFARAEEVVSSYFARRRDDPTRGTIEISGERYVLMRAASLSVEFFDLVRDLYGPERQHEADDFARNLLFDLAHGVGRSDARRFHARMELTDPIERLTAGPVHFSHTGWAFVDILEESRPVPSEHYYLVYNHPYSFEAGAWITAGKPADFPVCIMNAGYSSGWCQESFGVRLVASEVLCRARGDDVCRFVMAHPDRIERFVDRHRHDHPALAPQMRGYQIPDFFSRKRLEDELRRARDELEARVVERTAELEETNARLLQEMAARQQAEDQLLQTAKLEVVGRLAGGIAHDFNNLMGVVVGHASLLEGRLAADDPLRARLLEIRRAGEEAAQLTQQLLAFSRAQLSQPELIDPNALIADTVSMLERLIGEQVRLEVDLGPDLGAVLADRAQLRQVLMNLVVNARDAMPAGGTLSIQTRHLEDADFPAIADAARPAVPWVLVAVSDTGVGMDEATLNRAFEPFFTTKEPGVGTGLGLATVRRIVEQSGGVVHVTSQSGQGTTFGVHLPRAADKASPHVPGSPAGVAPTGTETVLVVEDQRAVREMVVGVLDELGYLVLAAGDPQAALALLARTEVPIDLLLTDVVMPGMSGHQLADRLLQRYPRLKVLYMSGYTDDEMLSFDRTQLKAALIAKPFTSVELAERIRQVLDAK